MAFSPQQLLNGQRVLRIPGLSSFSSCSFGRSFSFGSFNIGSLNGKSMELCEELVKRKFGICCIQEVRWRGMGSKFVGSSGRRFKLWWSGNEDKIGGVGILVREDLCMNVVEINRISDKVMVVVIIFGKKVVRIVCSYAPQGGRSMSEKEKFYEEMGRGCEVENANEVLICLGDFNGHIGKKVDGFEGVHGGFRIGKRNLEGRLLLEFCVEKDLCVSNSWFKKKDSRKVTFNGRCSGTEIDFVLMKKR